MTSRTMGPAQEQFDYPVLLTDSFDDILQTTGTATPSVGVAQHVLLGGRLLLQARGGAGKTWTAKRIALDMAGEGGIALLPSWLIDRYVSSGESLSNLARLAALDEDAVRPERLLVGSGVIILDGLNEIPRSAADNLLEAIPTLLARYPDLSIIVTDRLTRRAGADGWLLATLGPVPADTAQRLLNICDETRVPEHLRVPYYLNKALETGQPSSSQEEILVGRLTTHGGIPNDALSSTAEAAYLSYAKTHDRLLDMEIFHRLVPAAVVSEMWASGLLVDRQRPRFDHHLCHDYLAARHLAEHQELWTPSGFDTVTLGASSFDALALAAASLDAASADRYVHKVYDWNLYGAAHFLEEDGHGPQRVSSFMRSAILAMLAEKRFDAVRATAQRAEDALRLQSGATARALRQAESRNDVAIIARSTAAASAVAPPWAAAWLNLFTSKGSVTGEQTAQLESEVGIVGWAASNTVRRLEPSKRHTPAIIGLLQAHADQTVRWRAAHALAGSNAKDAVKALFSAVANDREQTWVRYGALRSLLEIAARRGGRAMYQILRQLASEPIATSIASDKHLTREAMHALDVVELPSNWHRAAEPLLSVIWTSPQDADTHQELLGLAQRWRRMRERES
ncbi:HEAT repeat domain-containing protein [uncultured Pseudokineococcus sp.]|uniref:HEAT repeat domain-containing protein n=1 Tax=uncultured Pseudokineococcus sp. TaxID=1642928 RepID=UPI00262A524B|nr:HEAT repeat domain-containing protein [uncultured Pseudokineococcus sp.]